MSCFNPVSVSEASSKAHDYWVARSQFSRLRIRGRFRSSASRFYSRTGLTRENRLFSTQSTGLGLVGCFFRVARSSRYRSSTIAKWLSTSWLAAQIDYEKSKERQPRIASNQLTEERDALSSSTQSLQSQKVLEARLAPPPLARSRWHASSWSWP